MNATNQRVLAEDYAGEQFAPPTQAQIEREIRALVASQSLGRDLNALVQRVAEFQRRNFPSQPLAAKLRHCKKEIDEVITNTADLSEWADVLILFLGAAAVNGITLPQLLAAARAKMDENEARTWPATPDADGIYHHIEEAR